MQVTADETRCIGAGNCALTAPDVFDQRDDDAIVVVLDPNPAADLDDDVRQAAELCPAAAITVSA